MLRKRERRTLSLMLILAMIFSLQVMPVHADAVQTLSLKVADKGGAVQTVKTLTYDQSKNVFMDGAEDSGLVKAFSDQPDGCYAYTGINRKPDPRVLAVATKGILVEDLIAYVQNVSGVKNLKGNTEISFLSSGDNREVKHTYDEYWGVQRYYYPEWYNADSYSASTEEQGSEVPLILSVIGYHQDLYNTGKTTISSLVEKADDQRALRILMGQQKGGNADDLNMGADSISNIDTVTFIPQYYDILVGGSDIDVHTPDGYLKASEGELVSMEVTAKDGLSVNSVSVVSASGDTIETVLKDGKYTFTMPASVVTVSAESKSYDPESAVWDGTIDVSWYNTEDTEFIINTPAQFAGLAAVVNGVVLNGAPVVGDPEGTKVVAATADVDGTCYRGTDDFAGKTVKLGADLDMGGVYDGETDTWSGPVYAPIGGTWMTASDTVSSGDTGNIRVNASFNGVFDGQGHTVSNVNCQMAAGQNSQSIGLIGRLGCDDAESAYYQTITGTIGVYNVAVSGCISGGRSVGGIVGKTGMCSAAKEIKGCANFAKVISSDKKGVGGIVGAGWNKPVIENCYNAGTVAGKGRPAGGIVGDNEGSVINCYNAGSIISSAGASYNMGLGTGGSYQNSYWLDGASAGGGVYSGNIVDESCSVKTAEEMKSDAFLTLINNGTEAFTADTDNINNGYPILSWQAAPEPVTVQITFATTPESASITVKDSAGNAVEPAEAGGKIYDLQKGETYTYVVSASGYTSVSDQITADETAVVTTVLSSSGGGSGGSGGSTGTGNVNASVWDGKSIDVSWYDPDKTDYYISTPADLAGLAAIVNGIYNKEIDTFAGNTKYIVDSRGYSSGSGPNGNNQSTPDYHYGADNFEGKTIHLRADIDMSGGNYMPIGGQYLMTDEDTTTRIDASFCGVFEGGGHTVYIECDRHCSKNFGDGSSIGLIGRLGVHDNEASMAPSGAAVYDVVVEGSVRGNRSVGGVVGKIGKNAGDALIENCANFAEVTGTDSKGTGGICGSAYNGGEIRNCYNAGEVSNSRNTYGGIAGSNEIKLTNCYNIGKVSGAGTAPAIATHSANSGTYENCYWLDSSADAGLYGGNSDQVIEKTSAQMKTDEFLALLGSAFAKDTKNINNGYPVLIFQSGGSASGGNGGGGGVVGEVDSKITVNAGTQGTVSVSPSKVNSGDKVTITVKPNTGYLVDYVNVTDASGKAIEVKDDGNGAYTFTMPSGKVTVNVTYKEDPAAQNPAAGKFADVADTAWYKEAVYYVADKGYFKGTSDTLFSPDVTMTRAMFATVIGRLAGIDESKYTGDVTDENSLENRGGSAASAGGSAFSDVPEGQWYSAYIRWASENDIVNGVGGGKFDPDAKITREQMAAMMYRYAKFAGVDLTSAAAVDTTAFNAFADRDSVSAYAKDAMIWATAKGIINGNGTGLAPKSDATRAQVAQIIRNYEEKA